MPCYRASSSTIRHDDALRPSLRAIRISARSPARNGRSRDGPLFAGPRCAMIREKTGVTERARFNLNCPLQVWIRGAAWIRGFCVGYLAAFDKHWNLAMTDVDETFTRLRKRKTPLLGESVTSFLRRCALSGPHARDLALLARFSRWPWSPLAATGVPVGRAGLRARRHRDGAPARDARPVSPANTADLDGSRTTGRLVRDATLVSR